MIKKLLLFLFGSLLLTHTALAGPPWTKFSYFHNLGGLNDILSTTEIKDEESSDLQNVVFDTGGAIKKRFGYRTIPNNPTLQVSSNVTGITGVAFYKKNDGSRYLVALANKAGQCVAIKKTYDVGGGLPSGAWDNITQSGVLPSNYTNNNLVSFTVAENNLVFCIPAVSQSRPFKWTGSGIVSTLTADSNCPTATIVAYFKNQLFLAGNSTNPSRVFFSALGDITTWTITDYFDVDNSDGQQVRALVPAFDALYIFKDKSIWRLSGSNRDNFILEKMVVGIGTLSPQSIAIVNNFIYFTTFQNDIAIYDGAYTVKFISQKIRNTIGGLNFSRATNTLGLAFSTYKYVDTDYYSSVSNAGSATNNRVLFFDTADNAWSKFVGINANSWCVAENEVGQNILVFGDYLGYVHYYPSTLYYDGDVSQSAISAHYQTKWFRYPDISLGDKYWRLLKIYALSETSPSLINVDCRSDYETSGALKTYNITTQGSLWDVAQWDVDKWGGQSLIIGRSEINKGKNMFQLYFYNDSVNQGFTLIGFENYIEPADRI